MKFKNAQSNLTQTDQTEKARFKLWQDLECLSLEGELFGTFYWKPGCQMMDFALKPETLLFYCNLWGKET